MNIRLRSIIRKEFIQIFRDKRTLAIILIIPIMQLFLLGYAATNDIRNIPLAVYDQCRCAESRALLNAYNAADYFKLTVYVTSEDEIRELIQAGTANAAIIIPPDYNTTRRAARFHSTGKSSPCWWSLHLPCLSATSAPPTRRIASSPDLPAQATWCRRSCQTCPPTCARALVYVNLPGLMWSLPTWQIRPGACCSSWRIITATSLATFAVTPWSTALP